MSKALSKTVKRHMKVLCISDNEIYELYEGWNDEEAEKLKDIGLILSAGDLGAEYLEFLVTMLNVPLLYVRGNHDSCYDEEPPEGCLDIDDKVAEIIIDEDDTADICENVMQGIQGAKVGISAKASLRKRSRLLRISGLGGSISSGEDYGEAYPAEDEFTEAEMKARVKKLRWMLKDYSIADKLLAADAQQGGSVTPLDILLTHSSAFGHGDLPDPTHTGFKCFNEILMDMKPAYHIYGHVHQEYGMITRECTHPSGTKEVNACGMHIIEL